MSILVGQRFYDPGSNQGARSENCEKCQLSYLYRPERLETKPLVELVPCPKCGWFQESMVKAAKKQRARGVFRVALSLALIAVVAHLTLFSGTFGPPDLAAFSFALVAGVVYSRLYDPNKGYQADSGLPSRAEASQGVLIDDFDGSELDDEILEREVFRCLRASMISMSGIDGEIHPSELVAISSVYQRVTGERVDIGTLENEARAAVGKTERMLKSLRLLAPYVDSDSKIDFLMSVRAIALADGTIDETESKLADQIAESLELSESEIEYTRKRGTTL